MINYSEIVAHIPELFGSAEICRIKQSLTVSEHILKVTIAVGVYAEYAVVVII